MAELGPGVVCKVEPGVEDRPLRDWVLLSACAQAMPETKAVVRQSASALRIDRFMFTLLANFHVKTPRRPLAAQGVPFETPQCSPTRFEGKCRPGFLQPDQQPARE
jgi:hypothetical protein